MTMSSEAGEGSAETSMAGTFNAGNSDCLNLRDALLLKGVRGIISFSQTGLWNNFGD